MPALELNVTYRLDLTDKVQLGEIKKQVLYDRLTDGRISGLLAEDLTDVMYSNIHKVNKINASFDLYDEYDRKYECRTLNKHGSSLLPADQVGSGRMYVREGHLDKLASLYAFVFIDVRRSPLFFITAIPVGVLGERKRVTQKQFDKFVIGFKLVAL